MDLVQFSGNRRDIDDSGVREIKFFGNYRGDCSTRFISEEVETGHVYNHERFVLGSKVRIDRRVETLTLGSIGAPIEP